MATYQAVASIGEAIRTVLLDARPKPEFANAQFELYQAANFQSPMDEGVSIFLYRVSMNGARRNLPPAPRPDGRRRRPPLPIDLHFLLTPWAKSPAKQQRLLGWLVRALEDLPILPAGLLNSVSPEPNIFQPVETIELIHDPVSFQDVFNIWESLKAKIQPSVTYAARMVTIESEVVVPEYPLVQTREFDLADKPTV